MAFEGGDGAGGGSAADVLTGGGAAAAGAGDAGAGAGAGADDAAAAAAAAAAGGAGADPDWYANVSGDAVDGESASLRDWLKASNVKDVNGLAKIARDSVTALRESGRIKVPGEGATAEEVTAYHKAIGVPDAPDGYQVAAIKDADGNDVQLDNPLLERLAGTAHKAGIPKAAYEALVNDYVQAQLEQVAGIDAEQQAAGAEWAKGHGDKAPAKLAAVNRAAQALGLSSQEVVAIRNALGAAKTLDTFAKLGEGIGEDVLIGDGSRQFLMSGEQAQAEINRMRGDAETVAKMTVKGTPEFIKYNRLLEIAGEAANRKAAAGL